MLPLATNLLKATFGYDSFRLNQEAIIDAVLHKQDVFALMPTGGGKSLCYQIPALIFDGLTVVVSPLIALMKDQVDALKLNGIEAAYLNSSIDQYEREEIFQQLRMNKLKLLYVSPERLMDRERNFLDFLKSLQISLFAIDEAHCISQWGHDFRPEYRMLSELKRLFPGVPTIALTATADELTRRDIVERLALRNAQIFVSSFNRANIHYFVEQKRNVRERIVEYLRGHREESGIIYTLSRASAESIADDLRQFGFGALPYHAGLDQQTRSKHQELFLRDEIKIVVATIAFGMGINKSNVRFVIHADLPKNIESYYQETGRAGRDGVKSEAILFYSSGDVMKLKRFVELEGNPEQTRVMLNKLSKLAALCETSVCRRKKMLNYFGEEAPETCASCDVCLSSFERIDATVIAQKAISAVARLEGTRGLTYLVDFLRGSKSEKICSDHKQLKTYGIGADISKDEWFRYIKELIARGFLQQVGAEYPVVKLTKLSESVLRGETLVELVRSVKRAKSRTGELAYNEGLFDLLKAERATIARSENVPAYLIFSDATLIELATYYPQSLQDLTQISGFGEVKLRAYGEQFLRVVVEYCQRFEINSKMNEKEVKIRREPRSEKSSDTKRETLSQFRAGKNIEEIAESRDLSPTTVEGHLVYWIERGDLKVREILPVEKIELIKRVALETDGLRLTPIKNILGEQATYGEIRAVLASLR